MLSASVGPAGSHEFSVTSLRTAWRAEPPRERTRRSTYVRGTAASRSRARAGPDIAGGVRSTLRDPVFRRLAAAYSVNELGNWLGDVALAVVVYDRTGSPLATAALFVAARFVPAL